MISCHLRSHHVRGLMRCSLLTSGFGFRRCIVGKINRVGICWGNIQPVRTRHQNHPLIGFTIFGGWFGGNYGAQYGNIATSSRCLTLGITLSFLSIILRRSLARWLGFV